MVMRYKVLFLVTVIALFACKKEGNVGSPTVQITAPTGKPTYKVFDTIIVKASVSDANSLKSVEIYIENSQNVPVTATADLTITGKQMSFTYNYVINSIHLTTGQYTLLVRASNGTNATYAYQAITIIAAPTIRLGIYAITRNGGINVTKIDSVFNTSKIYTQSGDYSSSDISSYYQQLYVAAADSGNVNAVDMPLGGPQWGVGGIIGPSPCFTNVYSKGDAAYVSDYIGFIKYYNAQGQQVESFKVTSGYYPIKTCIWSGYLFSEQKNIGATTRNLVLYYTGNALGYEQSALLGPITAMYGMNSNQLFVFGNKDTGGAYLQLFDIPGNIFYSPTTLPSGKLLSVAQIDSATYLMGFNNGTIYKYTYIPNGTVPFISGISAAHLQYDNVNSQVIASSGSSVYVYSYKSQLLLHSVNLQDSVLNVHVLYNK